MRRNYFALVAFLQLIIVDNSSAAMAQNLNLQTQMNQMAPTPQPVTPDFRVGRSSQPNMGHTNRAHHSVHHEREKQ
jgi:hypothetical protein